MKNYYSSIHLGRSIKIIILAIILSFPFKTAVANDYPGGAYGILNKCTGQLYLQVRKNVENCGTCDDDWLVAGNFQYKNTSNVWVSFATYSSGCGSNSCSADAGTTTLSSFGGIVDQGDSNWLKLYLNTYPSDLKYPIEFKFVYTWRDHGGGGDHDDVGWTETPALINLQTIEKPTALTASTDSCAQVTLNWDNAYQIWETGLGCTGLNYLNNIYRDGVYIGQVSGYATTYKDYTVSGNSNFSYRVQQNLVLASGGIISSSLSTAASGRTKAVPNQPTNFKASKTKCDSTIELTWEWNSINPKDFVISRGLSLNGTYTLIKTIDVNERFYVDSNRVRGTAYYYKIAARNECNGESGSSRADGISPSDPALATNLSRTIDSVNNTITIHWTDNATNETKYVIERQDDQGNLVSFNANTNATSFVDDNVSTCRLFKYSVRVFSDCTPSGLKSVSSVSGMLPPPNLNATFDTNTKKLTCSKGYFNNRVELTWANNNNNVLSNIKIFRKVLGTNLDSVQINSVTSGNASYIDNNTDAGLFYKYTLVGIANCNGAALTSNTSEDVGFRNPTAVINGHVQYSGGIAVKDVKVALEKSTGSSGFALTFDGVRVLSTPNTPKLSTPAAVTVECWARFDSLGNARMHLFEKWDSYYMYYDETSKTIQFAVFTNDNVYRVAQYSVFGGGGNPPITPNQYNHICGSFDSTGVKLFLNGVRVAFNPVSNKTIRTNTNALVIGGSGGYRMKGNMDEVRLWNISRVDADVKRDYERVLNGDESGLIGLYHADENNGNWAYDVSKTGNVFNAHHAQFTGTSGNVWSHIVPTTSQMGYFGYTNASGDYSINGIRYSGNGENFKVTPGLGVHNFSPGNKVLFIGDGAVTHNGVDFTDNSSFRVRGDVLYDLGSGCAVPDVYVLIDGVNVLKNNLPVKTDALGKFDIQVPIGEHNISVSLPEHVFKIGRYPSGTVDHDFQDSISGMHFIDSTRRIVYGRIVGGTDEWSKPKVMGRTKNNIGKATITFNATNLCYSATATTIDSSGEFLVSLLPLTYDVPDFTITTNASIKFQNNPQINLTASSPLISVYDTIWNGPSPSRIDSLHYHKFFSSPGLPFRTTPKIWVNNGNNQPFIGDLSYTYKNNIDSVVFDLTSGSPFGAPLFTQAKYYQFRVGAIETYENKDHNIFDTVAVKQGSLTINNDLGRYQDKVVSINLATKDTLIKFKGGVPNPVVTQIGGAPSFGKKLGIVYNDGQIANIEWKPNGSYFYGIVIGSEAADGKGFVSYGPDVVSHIMRDPPGTESSTTLEAGSTFTDFASYELGSETDVSVSASINAGAEFSTGIGVEIETSISIEASVGVNTTTNKSEGNEVETVTTITEAVSTSASPDLVGSSGDIYIGRAVNNLFGTSTSVDIVPNTDCGGSVPCSGNTFLASNNKTYTLASKKALALVPGGFGTTFYYTQNHILNVLIPSLLNLRNNLFSTSGKYVSKLSPDHDNYGINNDSPLLPVGQRSSTDPVKSELADYDGISYTFAPNQQDTVLLDSVRFFNQQIRLWQEAIAQNEKEKYQAQVSENKSFSAGASVTYTKSIETTKTTSVTYEAVFSKSVGLALEAEINGIGLGADMGLTITETKGNSKSKSTTEATTWSYTLSDPDIGDNFTVDIKKAKEGNGPIFFTKGGASSCPYEGSEKSLFYKNTSNNFVSLTDGTQRRELALLKINGGKTAALSNIPQGQNAVFNLQMINNSPTGDDGEYGLKIISGSNPDGAIVTIDGESVSTNSFPVAASSTLSKQLVVAKGPIEIDYDSITVIIHSLCNPDEAWDTIYFSVHFIPGCSPIAISEPLNQWVANSSFNNHMDVVIDGYDVNYTGLQSIELQYKPSSESTWRHPQYWYNTSRVLGLDSLNLSSTDVYTSYDWVLGPNGIPDGTYDMRAVSHCLLADYESPVFTGVIDRINPAPFGTPSPADGILDPNDDIAIQFNEPINIGTTTDVNFDVKAVLNETALNHATSLYFDGVNDVAEISAGANLQKRDFTIEFWAKRNTLGEQAIISQGTDLQQSVFIGFDAADKFVLRLGTNEVAALTASTNTTQWNHYAVSYNYATNTAYLFINNSRVDAGQVANLVFNYMGSGKLVIGGETATQSKFFKGNMHDVRLWNKSRSLSDVTVDMSKTLNPNTSGLLYNWRMDEADGTIANDAIRARNATITEAQWQINPNGSAAQVDGVDDVVDISSLNAGGITKEMDFTIEFWYKSAQATQAGLFSNGKGDGIGADTLGLTWSIQKDVLGKIHVFHKGIDFIAVEDNSFDGQWHHFALVMQRSSTLSAYLDGNLKNSMIATSFNEVGFKSMTLGARGYEVGSVKTYDNNFNGSIDEFRFWNLSRKAEQIKRDKQFRLDGNESGLLMYLPFESYQVDQFGIVQLIASSSNHSSLGATSIPVAMLNGAQMVSQTPTIKLPRPISTIPISFSINSDKIIITPDVSAASIENVTVDITTKGIKDLNGNVMQSPKTWIAYINKNQVKWGEQEFTIAKLVSEVKTFDATIVNTGGALKSFTIGNIPGWLQADITSGVISPNSFKTVHFTIDELVNIGEYEEDVALTTDFNFPEKLTVKLKVSAPEPTWTVDPAQFQYSQGIIGQVKIDGIISTNPDNKVAAFVGSECRGVTNLAYYTQYDKYFVVMDIYSNTTMPEVVTFKVWNAAEAKEHSDVTPTINFSADNIDGSFASPIFLEASDKLNRTIPLNVGWNWVSVNVACADSANVNAFMNSINATTGDIIKGQTAFADYSIVNNWNGSLANEGIKVEKSYRIKVAAADTLIFKGTQINPTTRLITINTGWNWIGFVSQRYLPVTEALGNLTPTNGDVIKGQSKFAMYDNILGWAGSLVTMQPNKGYMYKAASAATFTYPITGLYTKSIESTEQTFTTTWNVNETQFANSMSVIAKLDCATGQVSNNITLGAFVGTECRGVSVISNTEQLNGMFYLTVFSNTNNETVIYKLIDETNGITIDLDNISIFTNNGINGSVANPIELSSSEATSFCEKAAGVNSIVGNEASVIAKPNPFKDVLVLAVNLKTNSDVNLIIRNVTGQIVYTHSYNSVNKGTTEFNINLEGKKIAPGVYSIEIHSNSEILYLKAVKF